MQQLWQIIIPALVALVATNWIHPYILKVAKEKNIVDNPDARKLQRTPVPVLGGLNVVFGILAGIMTFNLFGNFNDLLPMFASIIIILIVGMLDDMISLSPKVRFVIEIALVLYLIYTTDCLLGNFHGLWGFETIHRYIAVPLTVVACVGIINAINLIDGVDGYSSGYSIISSILFGVMFYALGDMRMVTLAAIVAVSLLPFFLHNVFGKSSKMFIGDAGTLSLGIVFSVFVISIISTPASVVATTPTLGLVPFTMAVLCVPIFDTVRVMSARMLRGKSPFHPDKTHLHHLFIELGFSHIGTTMSIITLNLLVVAAWYAAYTCGCSVDLQFYLVVALGILITVVLYPFAKKQIRDNTAIYHTLHKIGSATHFQNRRGWIWVQRMIDGKE